MIANANLTAKMQQPPTSQSLQQQDVSLNNDNAFAKSDATTSFRPAHGIPINVAQNGPPVTSIFSKIMQLSKQDRDLLAIRLSNAQL
jgi:hypothetical protein